jgi:MauM/NapG family ferredoxin protein
MLGLTLVFGRVFCGFVCPLGASIDFCDRFILSRMHAPHRRPPRYFQRLKYVLLVVLLVLAVFGAAFPLFMDPISLLTRVATLVVRPLVALSGAEGLAVLQAAGIESLSLASVSVPVYYGILGTVLLFAFVVAGGFFDKRFWCQYVCPSGALFGLLSLWAPWRRVSHSHKCNSCVRCVRACPTRAIDEKHVARTSPSECVTCGVCTSLREGCSAFVFKPPAHHVAAATDVKRRHVLAGVLGGLALVPAFRANALSRRDTHGKLMRPPGALPEHEFLARCITCGACMKACPTGCLQPCGMADGVHRLNTPRVVPRVGGCDQTCSICGWVCPTGAIRKLPVDDKQFAKIGTAVIDRQRCLAWSQNRECLVCDETCPYNAIEARVEQTTKGPFKVPVVFEDVCIGCGMCEHSCPIDDLAAIVVYKFGENRRSSGPYATAAEKVEKLKRRTKSDQHLSVESAGKESTQPPAATQSSGSGLPAGFVQ